jgi:hypothetical protein
MLRSGFALTMAGTGIFLAQAPAGWEEYLVKGGSFAILCFVLLRMHTKTLPDMVKSHAEEISGLSAVFMKELADVREVHRAAAAKSDARLEAREAEIVALVKNCQSCLGRQLKLSEEVSLQSKGGQ